MKKIAIFQKDLKAGGIQKSLINLLKNIDLNKYEIDLYLFDNEIFFEDKLPKINIIYLKKQNYLIRFIPFSLLKKISKYNIDKEYDIVIDYNSYDQSCALASVNTKAKRYIMWIHNDVIRERKNDIKYRILHFFFKGKYKYFNEYVGVSNGVIEPFKKLNKINNAKFSVIPNLIDSEEIINKSMEKSDITVDNNKYNLISVGRLVIQKGFDILIEDMKKIVSVRKDIHLYIIGDGEKRKSLEKQIKKNNLENYITLLGSKSNPYKYEALMDGFILESRYEGQGIVVLEAKVLGLDIIIPNRLSNYVTDVPFTDDIPNKVINLKKNKNKKYDKLNEYNKNILEKIYKLFD